MQVRDMHIEINQSLQKVAANTTRKFLSEEIDWVLNKTMNRAIQDKVKFKTNGQVTLDQLGSDFLKKLVVSGKELETTVVNTDKVKALLPSNYMYLLADASTVLKACNSEYDEFTDSYNYVVIPVVQSTLSVAPYYVTSSITVNAVTISIPANLSSFANYYVGYNSKQDVLELVHYYLGRLRELGYEAYWETVESINKPGCIIVKANSGSWMVDSVTTLGTLQAVSYTGISVKTPVYYTAANRLEASENIPNLMNTPFYTTNENSPISELENDSLLIYKNKNFTVTNATISYIRKPKRISLALGVDCEISEEFHQTICDLSTEYLKGRLDDVQGNQMIERDINNRVIL